MEENGLYVPVIRCQICERVLDVNRNFGLYGFAFEYRHAKKYVTIFPGNLPFPGMVHICEKCANKIIKASKKLGLEGEVEDGTV